MVQCGKKMFIGRKEGIALAGQYTRYYVVFEDQVQHVGREMRRPFSREGRSEIPAGLGTLYPGEGEGN